MDTRGGAMSGYCSSGRVWMDMKPASMMMMARTQAKMGRLMKNCAMCGLGSGGGRGGTGRVGGGSGGALLRLQHDGLDRKAGACALQAIDHDALACLQSAVHLPLRPDGV